MKQRLYKIALSATILISVLLLSSCGSHEDEISIKIETYLQEEYGKEFEVLSWKQPKLLPSDNGVIHATCISKNDPKHPFEGRYFYDEDTGLEEGTFGDGYAERLLAKQMESMTEEAISQVAKNYYIQGDIIIPKEWQDIPVEEISQWENYVDLCNQSNSDYTTLGSVWVYIDASTMTGITDEEEYQMYEEVFRDKLGGEALLYVYYLDHKSFEKAEKILEISTSGDEGSNFEDIIEGQPYFGTIMRYGSDKFDDSVEIFKAAKQGKEQEKYQ